MEEYVWNQKCRTPKCDGIANIYSSHCFKCMKKRKKGKSKMEGYEKAKHGLEKLQNIHERRLRIERILGFWWGMLVMGIFAIIVFTISNTNGG